MLFALFAALTPTAHAQDVVWTGIDFGAVHLVGTQDFREPDAIFPGYFNKWNGLYLKEMKDVLQKRLRKPVGASTAHLSGLHEAADPAAQILRDDTVSTDEAFLSPGDVAARVLTYDTTATDGLGLTFIADQLNRPSRQGCFWVTFYDVGSKQVIQTSYKCGRASGIGFRNYWFGTMKDVTGQLKKKDVPR